VRLDADPAGATLLAGELSFPQIEVGLASLPRNSAIVVGCLYTPMLALRLLSPRVGITFGATIEIAAWIDTICTFLVVSAFNIVLSYFVISAYLDQLCEFLFRARGVNIGIFRGAFRRRIGLAVLSSRSPPWPCSLAISRATR